MPFWPAVLYRNRYFNSFYTLQFRQLIFLLRIQLSLVNIHLWLSTHSVLAPWETIQVKLYCKLKTVTFCMFLLDLKNRFLKACQSLEEKTFPLKNLSLKKSLRHLFLIQGTNKKITNILQFDQEDFMNMLLLSMQHHWYLSTSRYQCIPIPPQSLTISLSVPRPHPTTLLITL